MTKLQDLAANLRAATMEAETASAEAARLRQALFAADERSRKAWESATEAEAELIRAAVSEELQ